MSLLTRAGRQKPTDITSGNPKLNLAFVANLFNVCPGLEKLSEEEAKGLDFSTEGSREAPSTIHTCSSPARSRAGHRPRTARTASESPHARERTSADAAASTRSAPCKMSSSS